MRVGFGGLLYVKQLALVLNASIVLPWAHRYSRDVLVLREDATSRPVSSCARPWSPSWSVISLTRTAQLQTPNRGALNLTHRQGRATHKIILLTQIEPVLAHLESEGQLVRGEIRPFGVRPEWCDPELLRRLKRRTLAKLRKEVAPVDHPVHLCTLGGLMVGPRSAGHHWGGRVRKAITAENAKNAERVL